MNEIAKISGAKTSFFGRGLHKKILEEGYFVENGNGKYLFTNQGLLANHVDKFAESLRTIRPFQWEKTPLTKKRFR